VKYRRPWVVACDFATAQGPLAHLSACKDNRDGAAVLDHLTGRSKLTGAGFYSERHDGVACLIGRIQKPTRGIKTNKPRCGTLRRLPSDWGQRSVRCIGAIDGDAIVTTIGTVYEAAIRDDRDFSSGAVTSKLGRQRGDDLRWCQRCVLLLPAVSRRRAVELIEHPDDRQLRVERQMARSGAGARLDRAGLRRREVTATCIEAKNENAI